MRKKQLTSTVTSLTLEELAARWQARVQAGTFSQTVQGIGTIRVMGTSGDAAVAFPRITSLAALSELEADEQWAVHQVETMIAQARHRIGPCLQFNRGKQRNRRV